MIHTQYVSWERVCWLPACNGQLGGNLPRHPSAASKPRSLTVMTGLEKPRGTSNMGLRNLHEAAGGRMVMATNGNGDGDGDESILQSM